MCPDNRSVQQTCALYRHTIFYPISENKFIILFMTSFSRLHSQFSTWKNRNCVTKCRKLRTVFTVAKRTVPKSSDSDHISRTNTAPWSLARCTIISNSSTSNATSLAPSPCFTKWFPMTVSYGSYADTNTNTIYVYAQVTMMRNPKIAKQNIIIYLYTIGWIMGWTSKHWTLNANVTIQHQLQ